MKDIKRIVLTGGPCAGKTTALAKIVEHFSNLGYQVFTLPEVPTMFTAAGMNYLTKNKGYFYEGEKATLEIQLARLRHAGHLGLYGSGDVGNTDSRRGHV